MAEYDARHRGTLNVPNLLTGLRLAMAPVLLVLAWTGQGYPFLVLLALAFLTDIMDGLAARVLHQTSAFGARLDSWADVTIYAVVAIGGWWLWPDIVRREAPFVAAVVASYTVPTLVGLAKFRTLTSYHTWSVKVAAALIGLSVLLMFAGGPAWPFRMATPVSVLAAVEEIAITLALPELRSDVRSIFHVLRARG